MGRWSLNSTNVKWYYIILLLKLSCDFYIAEYKMCIIFDIFKYENAKEQKNWEVTFYPKRTYIYFSFALPILCIFWWSLSHTIKIQADGGYPALYFHLEHGGHPAHCNMGRKETIPEVKLTTSHNLLELSVSGLPSRNRKIYYL